MERDRHHLDLAQAYAAENSTCDRLRVGIVIVDEDNKVISKGYNTSLVGMETCDKDGHYLVDGHCIRTLHAEQMAVASAAKKGKTLNNTIAYLTHTPCVTCAKLLVACGVKSIIYDKEYSNILSREYLDLISTTTNIEIKQYKETK